MGSSRECTRSLGLEGFRVDRIDWGADGPRTRVRIWIERRGVRGPRMFRMSTPDVSRTGERPMDAADRHRIKVFSIIATSRLECAIRL